jgi:hypothetical protein
VVCGKLDVNGTDSGGWCRDDNWVTLVKGTGSREVGRLDILKTED